MLMLKLFFLTCSLIHLVTSQVIRITQHPTNDTYCEGSNAVLSCVIFDNSTNDAADRTNWFTNDDFPVSLPDSMISNSRDGDVVTSVLTIESVSLNDNGTGYFCFPSFGIASYVGVISVAGPPSDISDININEITACSFTVKWKEPYSNDMCDPVHYTVAVSTGGMVNITNTTLTNHTVTGLNDNTAYHVNVTANNNAGGSNATSMMTMTNSSKLPSTPPQITAVTPLNDTSFTVTWTILNPSYSYTVIWANIRTGAMDSSTVPEDTNSYTVTGLSDNDNYKVSVAIVDDCGMMKTSDPIIVYGPNEPQFEYCISYKNGKPTLQVTSSVIVDTPRMSTSLTFSASYQSGNSNSQSATCSLLSDMQYDCTAEFAVDIIPSVDTIESVNVTVSGPYGSASSLRNISERVNAIFSVVESDITENSATLISKLPCSSPDLLCNISNFTRNNVHVDMDVNMTIVTNTTSNVSDPEVTYSYPTHVITVNRLNRDTTYNYCVIAINSTDMLQVGEPVCGNLTTITTTNESTRCEVCLIIGICVAILIAIVLLTLIAIWWYYKGKRSHNKIDGVTTSKSTIIVAQLGDNPAYGCTSVTVTDDDKKCQHAEANVQESMTSDGTIKDDETVKIVATNSVQFMAPSNVPGQWYDHLADDNTKKPDDDDGNPMTNVGEVYHFNEQYQVNDTNEQQSHNDDEASREQLEQQSPVNAANTDEASVKSSEELTSLHSSNKAETTANNTKASAALPALDQQSPVNADEVPVKSSDELTSLPPTSNETNTTASNTATKTHAVASTQEQQSSVNPANTGEVPVKRNEESTSLSTSNEAAITASNTDTKTPATVPVNFYDPIQRYPSVIPHLNTSSGDKYALPSSKTKRVTKQSDNTASVNQEIPPYAIPDKSKKTRNQNTKHTDLDALPSPSADETQQINYADLEPLPPPASSMIPIDEGTNMYAKIA